MPARGERHGQDEVPRAPARASARREMAPCRARARGSRCTRWRSPPHPRAATSARGSIGCPGSGIRTVVPHPHRPPRCSAHRATGNRGTAGRPRPRRPTPPHARQQLLEVPPDGSELQIGRSAQPHPEARGAALRPLVRRRSEGFGAAAGTGASTGEGIGAGRLRAGHPRIGHRMQPQTEILPRQRPLSHRRPPCESHRRGSDGAG